MANLDIPVKGRNRISSLWVESEARYPLECTCAVNKIGAMSAFQGQVAE